MRIFHILLFLISSLTCLHANLKYQQVYITGPELTIDALWKQVEARSPYKVEFDLPDPKKKTIHIQGLVEFSTLFKKTHEYFAEYYRRQTNIDITGQTIKIYQKDKREDFKRSKTEIKKNTPTPKPAEAKPSIQKEPVKTQTVEIEKKALDKSTTPKTVEPPKSKTMQPSKDFDMGGATPPPSSKSKMTIVKRRLKQKMVYTPEPKKETRAMKQEADNQELMDFEDPEPTRKRTPQLPVIQTKTVITPMQPTHQPLKPGDTIEITVAGEDMAEVVTVTKDGMITTTLTGKVKAGGSSLHNLERSLEEKFKEYLLNPDVIIRRKSKTINKTDPSQVMVTGAVKTPGSHPYTNNDRILDSIKKAGGLAFEELGKSEQGTNLLSQARLTRNSHKVDIDFSKLLNEGDMSQNIKLQAGDHIHIPFTKELTVIDSEKELK